MLDRLLKNALDGITLIEEETGGVSRMLARQLGGYAKAAGKRVVYLSLDSEEKRASASTLLGARNILAPRAGSPMDEARVSGESGVGSPYYGKGQRYVFLEGLDQDAVIIESFSTFLFDKPEKDIVDLMREITRLVKEQKKTFIIAYDNALLSERMAAYLRACADTVIIIKTELAADRVTRMLYIPKLRDSRPMDRLIKITVDERGIQEDTREYVG